MKNTQKTQKLGWLEPEDSFEIPSLKELMRNLRVISTNESSTSVQGERRDSVTDDWKSFRFPISNDVNVVIVEKSSKESTREPKLSQKTENKNMNTENAENVSPRRRGRPSKHTKPLNELGGTSGEFTVNDIVSKNDIKEYEAHNLVRSALKQGKVTIVKEISGGRGKPKKVYRLS
jgi:hypothetical protein